MAEPNKREAMLTVSDVARLLNVHTNTVRRWTKQGILETYRIGLRGDRRFYRESVLRFLSNQKESR